MYAFTEKNYQFRGKSLVFITKVGFFFVCTHSTSDIEQKETLLLKSNPNSWFESIESLLFVVTNCVWSFMNVKRFISRKYILELLSRLNNFDRLKYGWNDLLPIAFHILYETFSFLSPLRGNFSNCWMEFDFLSDEKNRILRINSWLSKIYRKSL